MPELPREFDMPRFLNDLVHTTKTVSCGWCDRPLGGTKDGNGFCSQHCRDAWMRGSERADA